ncbi:hypothetical protein ACFL27_14135 [candidate division CSSED10-310 bacterium]|uniref:YkuD domain-containing protein n=1 Tax=candidate division CSSED10-310 bacterium TaxID=2855610 RepID=A0ABV6YYR2_UNCC1
MRNVVRFVIIAGMVLVGHSFVSTAENILTIEEQPRYGVYFNKLEPAFYTGFAPRCQDPRRIHLHVGRGNQLRVTVVISHEASMFYARDLLYRYMSYKELIDEGKLVLTQNRAFEEFEQTIRQMNVEQMVKAEETLSPEEIRSRNLTLLSELNPGRLFHIKMSIQDVIARWLQGVTDKDKSGLSTQRKLDLVNDMLPTRLFIAELSSENTKLLKELIGKIPGKSTPDSERIALIKPHYLKLLEKLTGGIYEVDGQHFRFTEFTAIYPIGTLNDFTTYKEKKIPLYPAPGRRALTTHQRTKTVDHIPTKEIYSFFPWIPYMHVGETMHNSFHTLWWQLDIQKTAFIPQSWKKKPPEDRQNGPLSYLWLLSRGPMSHGCTHLNAGHISEFRQVLPSEPQRLYQIDNFRNKSFLYDVFDIDGDLKPEVMGVKYYITYSLKDKEPYRLRVRNEKKAYYEWLYTDELLYDPDGKPFFKKVQDAKFVGRRTKEGKTYQNIRLYEAEYKPERIQFFEMVDIPFIRDLRKTAVTFQK